MSFSQVSRIIEGIEVRSGDVIRLFEGAFNDSVVLGFNKEGDMKVSRPYIYVSSANTGCPSPLTGVETFTIPGSQVKEYLTKLVDNGRISNNSPWPYESCQDFKKRVSGVVLGV